jgi:hypothetical protein
MLGLHLFGSVINISAVDMVGDRFSATHLRREHLLLLSRGYSSAAFWSPFWGAAAAVLTYSPTARVEVLMTVGGCLAATALGISGFTVTRAFGPRLSEFHGYPLTLQALGPPLALVVIVLAVHVAAPDIPIVAIITICAPVLAVLVVTATTPRAAPRRMTQHAVHQLPATSSELVLFLSAGLLVAGLTPLAGRAVGWLPIDAFTAWEAWGLVGVMAAVSALGVHPVISIAISASVLAPLEPNPTLFAMAGLIAWGLQAAAGPLNRAQHHHAGQVRRRQFHAGAVEPEVRRCIVRAFGRGARVVPEPDHLIAGRARHEAGRRPPRRRGHREHRLDDRSVQQIA